MSEKIRIVIDIEQGFSEQNYTALKSMMDAYVGEFISAGKAQTSNQPFGDRRFDNEIKFILNFNKVYPEPIEYQP